MAPSPEIYMLEALRLARQGGTLPYPNPWAGCVIVRAGKIVGRGSHCGPGTNHAEVAALGEAGRRARGASLYVNLEPCCHYGRTPPCTDAILRAGIHRVYYAIRDPNPEVRGRSGKLLRACGLTVRGGLCAREAASLNEVYLKFRATGLPFVTVKTATSLDGKIRTRSGESKWITDVAARRRGRELRDEHQAVLVGINTVLADNPSLGTHARRAAEPWRVILDTHLRLPAASQVVRSGRCIVACSDLAKPRRIAHLERLGVKVWQFPGARVPIKPLLARLAENGIISLLVEGGSEVLGSFFDEGVPDRVYWFLAPLIVGAKESLSAIGGLGAALLADAWRLQHVRVEPVGKSWLVRGDLSRWAATLEEPQ
jgi:diaminohydroxyphosphoribosylaminopyrimidine deaminase/5-amino-6-(5-phosphoribosylamino)uracil reductase